MWFVYIVQCSDGSLYTGITKDTVRRIKEHNIKKGGSYTRARLPVRLVYKEEHPTRSKALKREAQLKKFKRQGKIALISQHKPSPRKFHRN
ncbi:MAG: GIY-YIG nuclease family protein [Candidatus Omnitrophota bacterium]